MFTAALTVRQAVLTADTVMAGSLARQGSDVHCSLSEAERASIQAVYLSEANGLWPRSDASKTRLFTGGLKLSLGLLVGLGIIVALLAR